MQNSGISSNTADTHPLRSFLELMYFFWVRAEILFSTEDPTLSDMVDTSRTW
jgi:hypothetical protein